MIRKIAILGMLVAAVPAHADLKAAQAGHAKLLTTYVTGHGVRYATWRTNGDDLKRISEVVMIYRSADLKTLEPHEREAVLINLYNTKILETILLLNPSGSIRALSKALRPNEIFHRNALLVDGKPVSLDELERRLVKEYKDPRIHFALNSSARSCAPLRAEPYYGNKIDDQLDDATRAFLATPGVVTIDTSHHTTVIKTSTLFDWYKDDFKPLGGTLGVLKKFGSEAVAEAASAKDVKVEYQPWDWSLNVAP
ncbi:MAG TPA: DUF547 domain-containing protein [Candidatus Polarisedimenticolaceae bacterium]|nr:DUF547 domain-containing protein [Candidatus Polarisedimenticolaceae bacterium]